MLETGSANRWDCLGDGPWDAIVIGAGPAGAMAARQLAGRGVRVLLVERRRFPRGKVCGGCLNGRALAVLDSVGMGSLVAGSGGIPLGEFRLHFRGRLASIRVPAGAALSRERLDAELVQAAVAMGAQFLPETQACVSELLDGMRLVQLKNGADTRLVRARVVLAASGLGGSCLALGTAPRTRIRPGSRIGASCRIAPAPSDYPAGAIDMAVADQGYVGLVRLEDGSLNVAGAFQPELVRRHGTPGAAALRILAEAGIPPIVGLESTRWEGTAQLTRHTRPIALERLFLLGDAAGYVEPFTGEGMTWALATGQAIAPLALRAIKRWDSRLCVEWDALHRRIVRDRQVVCRGAATVLHRPWLVRLGFEVIARLPNASGRILGHLNATPSYLEAH